MKKLMFALATAAVAVGAQAGWGNEDPDQKLTPEEVKGLPPAPAIIANPEYQAFKVTYTIKCPVVTEKQVLKAASLAKKGVQGGILESPDEDVVYAKIGSKKFTGVIASKFKQASHKDGDKVVLDPDGTLETKYAALWCETDKAAIELVGAGVGDSDLFGQDGTVIDSGASFWGPAWYDEFDKTNKVYNGRSFSISGGGFGKAKFDKKAGTVSIDSVSGNASMGDYFTGVPFASWRWVDGSLDANYKVNDYESFDNDRVGPYTWRAKYGDVWGPVPVYTNWMNLASAFIGGYGTFSLKADAKIAKALNATKTSAEAKAAFIKAAGLPKYFEKEYVLDARFVALSNIFDGDKNGWVGSAPDYGFRLKDKDGKAIAATAANAKTWGEAELKKLESSGYANASNVVTIVTNGVDTGSVLVKYILENKDQAMTVTFANATNYYGLVWSADPARYTPVKVEGLDALSAYFADVANKCQDGKKYGEMTYNLERKDNVDLVIKNRGNDIEPLNKMLDDAEEAISLGID